MWQTWVNGILGLWVILIPFLNLSLSVERTVLIITGIVVAALGFWAASGKGEGKSFEAPMTPPAPPTA